MDAKFFVIREPSAGFRTDPTKTHPTGLEARDEARRLCEHDTDGDGDCHLCVRWGKCLLETQSQQAQPATSPEA